MQIVHMGVQMDMYVGGLYIIIIRGHMSIVVFRQFTNRMAKSSNLPAFDFYELWELENE